MVIVKILKLRNGLVSETWTRSLDVFTFDSVINVLPKKENGDTLEFEPSQIGSLDGTISLNDDYNCNHFVVVRLV